MCQNGLLLGKYHILSTAEPMWTFVTLPTKSKRYAWFPTLQLAWLSWKWLHCEEAWAATETVQRGTELFSPTPPPCK